MPLSTYHKAFPDESDRDSIILFSTKKASIIKAPAALFRKFERGHISATDTKLLSELGFLVESRQKEQFEMYHYFDELDRLNHVFKAYIVLNLDCNLACKYCFEGSRKGRYYMTRKTADCLIAFIGEKIRSGLEDIRLVFYGGEPLLSTDLIIYISEKVRALREGKGLSYGFSLITNGTLLTGKTASILKPLGLRDVSVTLDGPKRIHDAFRPFKSGKGSFDIILRNIRDACDVTDVQIGGNYTRENYSEFPELLDFCLENGLNPGRISDVRFDCITRESERFALPDFHDGVDSVNEPWLAEANLFLRGEILKRGFRAQKIVPVSCMMEFRDRMIIHYNGDIYKCPGLIGREEFRVGDIRTGLADYRDTHNLDNWKNRECLACAYLPLCFGSCRYIKYVRDGSMDGIDCRKPYFDAALSALVHQDVRYYLVTM